jgi:hypothetical protein
MYAGANMGHPSAAVRKGSPLKPCPSYGLKAVPFILLDILRAVFCKPRFVCMEKRNGVLNIFIRRPVVSAHHIVLYQVFELGPVLKIHTLRLPEFHGCATQN